MNDKAGRQLGHVETQNTKICDHVAMIADLRKCSVHARCSAIICRTTDDDHCRTSTMIASVAKIGDRALVIADHRAFWRSPWLEAIIGLGRLAGVQLARRARSMERVKPAPQE
jgi:hypothetical protein